MSNRKPKADRSQMKQHNWQLVLRHVFTGEANSRVALAYQTGLAKPTVSDIVGDLIEQGYLREVGQGDSSPIGGKRPTLLEFVSDARQVIGVVVTPERLDGVLAYLDGQITARHYVPLDQLRGDAILNAIIEAVNSLIAQLDDPREEPARPQSPLVCIGVGIHGSVDSRNGIVEKSLALGWRDVALAELLRHRFEIPVYVANNTELVARAHMAFGDIAPTTYLVTVLLNHSVEIGIAAGGRVYHHSSGASFLPVAHHGRSMADFLGMDYLRQQAQDNAMPRYQPAMHDSFTHLELRYWLNQEQENAQHIFDALTDTLAELYAWIIAVNRPNHIALAGHISDLGNRLLDTLRAKLHNWLPADVVNGVTLTLMEAGQWSATGAVAHALQQELGLFV